MCRNIKTLYNFDPPATEDEIQAAALQFIRKLSGFYKPSKRNEIIFNSAIQDVSVIAAKLLNRLETNSSPRNREVEKAKARERSARRFPQEATS